MVVHGCRLQTKNQRPGYSLTTALIRRYNECLTYVITALQPKTCSRFLSKVYIHGVDLFVIARIKGSNLGSTKNKRFERTIPGEML